MPDTDFVGRGWAFPLGVGPSGGIATVGGAACVEAAIELILGTAYGERPLRPEFGCGVHDLVFGGADAGAAGRISYEVRASLLRWEPRVEVLDVAVEPDPVRDGGLLIDVRYVIRSTNDRRNLVFPFYSIPDGD